jgi:hypothetical protein
MIKHPDFPRLTAENHRVTSPATPDYNCVAWSANDTERWWQPGVYWPVDFPQDEHGLGALEQAFMALDYEYCADGKREAGFEKVALYGSGFMYTHAARQLPSGKWTKQARSRGRHRARHARRRGQRALRGGHAVHETSGTATVIRA